MTDPKLPATMNAAQAADALGCSLRTLWRETKAGNIPHMRVGKLVRYPTHTFNKWMDDQARKGMRR